jgi:hypothetical protein
MSETSNFLKNAPGSFSIDYHEQRWMHKFKRASAPLLM